VLLPLLWCLVVNDLIARLSGSGIFIQRYADDMCLLSVGKFPNTVSGFMQWALLIVEICCSEIGLSVNPDWVRCFYQEKKTPRVLRTMILWS